ncbi:MAG: glycosyltransferase [Phycisphaeraceae bacterium]|nr:glycosyltransferase [Phycisphaeraceae bacterium]
MMSMILLVLLLVVWLAWLTQAIVSALQVAWFGDILSRPWPYKPFHPRAWVIVPFKGLEHDLAGSLTSLLRQDYPDYRVVLVVEAESDPAYPVLTEAIRLHAPDRAELIVAGLAPPTRSQKLHNQLAALAHVGPQSRDDDVWVFADSDAVPGPHWLDKLVSPLSRTTKYGLSTGYRWLTPPRSAPLIEGIWSDLACVLNSSVACMLGRSALNFAWGGSMAMPVSVARRGGLIERWSTALTDDYPASTLCRSLDLKIAFVPACLVSSPVRFDERSFWNFARRQYLITRVYAPAAYLGALALTGLYTLAFCTAAAVVVGGVVGKVEPWLAWSAAAVILAVTAADITRSHFRRRVVRLAFGDTAMTNFRRAMWLDRWATPLWMALHLAAVLSALSSRTLTWRGRRYRLRGPHAVEQLD